MWVRGLKQQELEEKSNYFTSHPVWVRGLKRSLLMVIHLMIMLSHPVWVRGLKQRVNELIITYLSRTPCGCVD